MRMTRPHWLLFSHCLRGLCISPMTGTPLMFPHCLGQPEPCCDLCTSKLHSPHADFLSKLCEDNDPPSRTCPVNMTILRSLPTSLTPSMPPADDSTLTPLTSSSWRSSGHSDHPSAATPAHMTLARKPLNSNTSASTLESQCATPLTRP